MKKKNDIILMDFTGTYKEQQFYQEESVSWVEVQELSGCNCYCDNEAQETLEDFIRAYPVRGIHFLDSGNYHYVSLLWLKKIQEPFCLLLFDNHTDMQPPAFGGLLSCGGWAAEALETLPFLRELILAGPDQASFDQTEPVSGKQIRFLSRELLRTEKKETLLNFFRNLPEGLPVYVSVDKDVLCPEDASTDWSQGDMKLMDLEEYLREVFGRRRILGMDVCGECSASGNLWLNDLGNKKMLTIWKDWRDSHEK
ncbi:MAG: arginase family protein [Blautia sp.]|uniref:arginase family protein n=1 Tax=Blautia sp. TaxID=1955243 RepID=UPI0039934D97